LLTLVDMVPAALLHGVELGELAWAEPFAQFLEGRSGLRNDFRLLVQAEVKGPDPQAVAAVLRRYELPLRVGGAVPGRVWASKETVH
jgi:hypothetical protein